SEPPVGANSEPSKSTAAAEGKTLKPEPFTVNVVPTGPWFGVNVISGVTSKDAVARSKEVSTAMTFCPPSSPLGASGTVKVQGVPLVPGKLPVPSVQQSDAAYSLSKVNSMGSSGPNPVPAAATTLPGGPDVGYRANGGAVKVNRTPAQSPRVSFAQKTLVPGT